MPLENTPIIETHSLSKRYGRGGVLPFDFVDMSVRGAMSTADLGNGNRRQPRAHRSARTGQDRLLIESPGFYPYLSGRETLMVVAASPMLSSSVSRQPTKEGKS